MISTRPSVKNAQAPARVLITGGAGYIGSLLTGVLLSSGYHVTVVDDLWFGGESLLGYWFHPDFEFIRGDVSAPGFIRGSSDGITVGDRAAARFFAVIHLAATVGYPACQAAGRQAAWWNNVEATERVFEAADQGGAARFIFSSTYSNYGIARNGQPVTETSPLYPQSLYAETKIASEEWLIGQAGQNRCAPLIFRFATLFGISPRTRFDLIINQFVLEAMTKNELVLYDRTYTRSFLHVRDVAESVRVGLTAAEAKVRGEIYNVGSEKGNCSKDTIVALICQHVPGVRVRYRDEGVPGDMRDIAVSFGKIRCELGYEPRIRVEDGIVEMVNALQSGIIKDPLGARHYNAGLLAH